MVITLVLNSIVSTPVWGGVGIWVNTLEQHFGWSRTQLTGAFSVGQLEGSVAGPLVGYFTDRFGTRRMVVSGLVILGGGFIVLSQTTNLLMLYLAFATTMLGASVATWIPMMTAINHWFYRKRGTAMGYASVGFSLGGVALAPVLAWSVVPEHFGWQTTAFWIGILFLVIAWPVSRLIKNRPAEYGQQPDGDEATQQPDTQEAGPIHRSEAVAEDRPDFTAWEAVRTPAFWLISIGHGLSSMLVIVLGVHLIPSLVDQGLSLQTASYVLSATMLVTTVFQVIGGYVGDRVPKNVAIFVFNTIQAGGFAMAALVHDLPMAFVFAVVYGIGFGGRVPLTTAIRGDYFGQRAFATITGISGVPMSLFMLAGPLFAAYMYDSRGSYLLPFSILACLGGLSGVLFLLAKKPTMARSAPRAGTAGRTS